MLSLLTSILLPTLHDVSGRCFHGTSAPQACEACCPLLQMSNCPALVAYLCGKCTSSPTKQIENQNVNLKVVLTHCVLITSILSSSPWRLTGSWRPCCIACPGVISGRCDRSQDLFHRPGLVRVLACGWIDAGSGRWQRPYRSTVCRERPTADGSTKVYWFGLTVRVICFIN